jgi:hypothetical protein
VRDRRGVGKDDRDSVETNLTPSDSRARRVGSCGSNNIFLLVAANGTIGSAIVAGRACFNFHKHNRFALARNNIGFDFTIRGAIIPGNNQITRASQIPMRKVFAAFSKRRLRRQCLPFPKLTRAITQLPEELPRRENACGVLIASSSHSMTLPRMR